MPHKLKLRDRQGGDLLRLAGTAAEVIFAVVPGAVEAEAGTGVGHGPHNFQNTLVKAHKIAKTTYQSNAKEPATGPAVRPVIISRTHCRASWTCSLLWPVMRSSLGPLFRARMLTSQPVADRTALRSAAVKVAIS